MHGNGGILFLGDVVGVRKVQPESVLSFRMTLLFFQIGLITSKSLYDCGIVCDNGVNDRTQGDRWPIANVGLSTCTVKCQQGVHFPLEVRS